LARCDCSVDIERRGSARASLKSARADAALLDTYEQERIPVAKQLLETTDRAFQIIVSDGWFGALFRTKIMARVAAIAMRFAFVRTLAFRTIAQIGISYPKSALSQNNPGLPKGAPAAGDRFPWLKLKFDDPSSAEDLFEKLDDTRFNLLVFGQAPTPNDALSLGDLCLVHTVPADPFNDAELARVHVPQPSFYLLRPDGHIGLCGAGLDVEAINRYVSERLHLQSAGTPTAHRRLDRPAGRTAMTLQNVAS
jgi:hypothetical protein